MEQALGFLPGKIRALINHAAGKRKTGEKNKTGSIHLKYVAPVLFIKKWTCTKWLAALVISQETGV